MTTFRLEACRERHARLALLGLLFSACGMASVFAGDAVRGKTLYDSRCTACHALDGNREGPAHRGVFGRKAGTAPDFAYSAAVKNSGVVWNEQTLDKWLTNPETFLPGQEMGFLVADATDRADLIAYLRSVSSPGKGSGAKP
jgi:cytochrome c